MDVKVWTSSLKEVLLLVNIYVGLFDWSLAKWDANFSTFLQFCNGFLDSKFNELAFRHQIIKNFNYETYYETIVVLAKFEIEIYRLFLFSQLPCCNSN